jgi:hypothetical protein
MFITVLLFQTKNEFSFFFVPSAADDDDDDDDKKIRWRKKEDLKIQVIIIIV